ncbi:hypothetical protein Peur_031428 [Populus x canadensis]
MRTALHHRHGKLGMTEECSNVQTSYSNKITHLRTQGLDINEFEDPRFNDCWKNMVCVNFDAGYGCFPSEVKKSPVKIVVTTLLRPLVEAGGDGGGGHAGDKSLGYGIWKMTAREMIRELDHGLTGCSVLVFIARAIPNLFP